MKGWIAMTSKHVSFLTYFKNKEERTEMIEAIEKQLGTKKNEVECSQCGKKMITTYSPYIFHYNVGKEKRELTIKNAPHYECKCGHKIINLFLYAEVEKAIENEIFYRLNKNKKIPDTVEFNELIG